MHFMPDSACRSHLSMLLEHPTGAVVTCDHEERTSVRLTATGPTANLDALFGSESGCLAGGLV
jgi:hypothetical protein